jgi:hypothetical protein
MSTDVPDLEHAIKQLDGVLGCVILTSAEGVPSEIQAFTQKGTDREEVERSIMAEVDSRGLSPVLQQISVFELEAESYFGDLDSLTRAAELAEQEARIKGSAGVGAGISEIATISLAPRETASHPPTAELKRRPPLLRVELSSTSQTSEAKVALADHSDQEIVGIAEGEKTPHGLRVLAEATLEAVSKLVPSVKIELRGASLVAVVGEEAVLVIVEERDGPEMLGAALVRGGPVTEATVRATLDAINGRFAARPHFEP